MPASMVFMTLLPPLFSGADLSGLLELPQSLSSLCGGGAAFDDEAAAVLGRLTQLKDLCLSWAPGFTDAGLEQLTDLDLARLFVHDAELSEAISPYEVGTIDLKFVAAKVR
jgi:hypothetical protein